MKVNIVCECSIEFTEPPESHSRSESGQSVLFTRGGIEIVRSHQIPASSVRRDKIMKNTCISYIFFRVLCSAESVNNELDLYT